VNSGDQIAIKTMRNDSSNLNLEALAAKAIRLRLEAPLAFFLEAHLPISTLIHQAGVLFEPMMTPLFGAERTGKAMEFFSRRENIEEFIALLNEETVVRGCAQDIESGNLE
jgi:hypothetical protein